MLARSLLALALLANAPSALAFPPCPVEPLELQSVDDTGSASVVGEPWYLAQYALVGDPSIIDEIKPIQRAPAHGKCRDYDALRVPTSNHDDGVVELSGRYAPVSGFGVIALPDLRALPQELRLRHTLEFVVDSMSLASAGDWIDIAELRFRYSTGGKVGNDAGQASSAYRIRKHSTAGSGTVLEVIQAQGSAADASMLEQRPGAIARLNIAPGGRATRIALRMSQFKSPTPPTGDEFIAPIIIDPIIVDPVQIDGGAQTTTGEYIVEPLSRHDSLLEVLDGDGAVIARVWLESQWPGELSMGLLNYNVQSASAYPSGHRLWIEEMSLKAETF